MADKEKYCIPIGGTRIEVEKAVYEAYYKMSRRERYMEERDESNGVVSYHAMEANGIDGEAGLRDMSTDSLETVAMAKELHEQLHRCIAALPKAERELIHAIYFDGMTETEYSQKVKLSQSGISRRRKKTLSKLRELMNIIGFHRIRRLPPSRSGTFHGSCRIRFSVLRSFYSSSLMVESKFFRSMTSSDTVRPTK